MQSLQKKKKKKTIAERKQSFCMQNLLHIKRSKTGSIYHVWEEKEDLVCCT